MDDNFKCFVRFLKENRAYSSKKFRGILFAKTSSNIYRWVSDAIYEYTSENLKLHILWLLYVYYNNLAKDRKKDLLRYIEDAISYLKNKEKLDNEEAKMFPKLLIAAMEMKEEYKCFEVDKNFRHYMEFLEQMRDLDIY